MRIEFDPGKDAANLAKHGVSLADFVGFDDAPSVSIDDRYDYRETRYRAVGRIGGLGFCLVFVVQDTGTVRAISFRRAHEK